MKSKMLILALAVGMTASSSASAFGYWNNATYAARFRPDPQPMVYQAKPEVQVAVMAASSTSQKGATGERVWGKRNWCASHSH